MNAIEKFRESMRKLDYTEAQINDDIHDAVRHARMVRRRDLLDELEKACHEMTDEQLKALEGGEL